MTTISVFGLGYVGCVAAACLAKEGHSVIGVEVSPAKVDSIRNGRATILEAGISELVAGMVAAGRLTATVDAADAVRRSSVTLMCVGTPSRPNGSIDTSHVQRASTEIGWAIKEKPGRHVVVLRSTVLPGTIETVVIPALEAASGKKVGRQISVCANPEFLREGTSIHDYYHPPFTVIGAQDPKDAEEVTALYRGIDAPVHIVPLRVAEMLKYACNSFHGLKVGFANEIGNICKALRIDGHEVMRLLCEDRKLNISPAYLRPGFAFGGSCLPKDLRAIVYRARQEDVDTPVLAGLLESNRKQVTKAAQMVLAAGSRRVGILGLAFKAGTDDLRESPMVSLIEILIGKGLEITIFDRDVSRSNLIGANREYIEREIPHIWSLLRNSIDDVLASADVIVIGNGTKEFGEVESRLSEGQIVVDVVRAFGNRSSDGRTYEGICW